VVGLRGAGQNDYLNELMTFPKGKYDDQVDSTSQALEWFKVGMNMNGMGLLLYYRMECEKMHGLR
jgi:phage terminase large subunit-like protein